jgi:hypothetical protein
VSASCGPNFFEFFVGKVCVPKGFGHTLRKVSQAQNFGFGGQGMQARSQRRLYQGFGDANTRAIELVVSPLLLALIGFWIAGPIVALVSGLVGFAGAVARAYYQYKANMAAAEEGKPWAK